MSQNRKSSEFKGFLLLPLCIPTPLSKVIPISSSNPLINDAICGENKNENPMNKLLKWGTVVIFFINFLSFSFLHIHLVRKSLAEIVCEVAE